ncbi:MAG: signal peptidase I [Clostridia bacterium]|nr:signal peptidase I [Clostridia bacterium]
MGKVKMLAKELVIAVGTAIFLSFLLQTFVFEARSIPTCSMEPTIQINQKILVNKFIYRFKSPQRGDIIVFTPPENKDNDLEYIKRVIGLPGDKIEIKDGFLYLNDKLVIEEYVKEKANYEFGPVKVPENCLFVLGDNRNESYDSHAWSEWLTLNLVKGKAFFTYWPIPRIGFFGTEVSSADIGY